MALNGPKPGLGRGKIGLRRAKTGHQKTLPSFGQPELMILSWGVNLENTSGYISKYNSKYNSTYNSVYNSKYNSKHDSKYNSEYESEYNAK